MKKNTLILNMLNFNKKQLEDFKKISPGIKFICGENKNFTEDDYRKADVIWGWPDSEKLKIAANLKWLQLGSAGVDRHVDSDLYQNKVILTNASGVYGPPIAEHILGMILAFNRNIHIYIQQQINKKWQSKKNNKDFFDSTLAIIGLGDIGCNLARRAKQLGANVLAVKRTRLKKPDFVDELFGPDDLKEVLMSADYIALTLPLTDKTRGIISEKEFMIMKNDSFIVNVGRGPLIDQDALIKALEAGLIGGAGLDVTDPEPLPEESPLWNFENVIISPHDSGRSPSNDKRIFEIFKTNLVRFINKEKLINVVDFEQGY